MIIDRVNFNDDAVSGMSKGDFIAMHVEVLWQDRDEATRRKMLSDAYDRMADKPKRQKNTK